MRTAVFYQGGIGMQPGYPAEVQHQHGHPYGSSHVARGGGMLGDISLGSAMRTSGVRGRRDDSRPGAVR